MPRSRDGIMRQVLTVAQMRAAEDDLISAGTSVDALMQQAGRGAGEWVRRIAGGGSVTVLCGPGNNGGDGWVIAEYLREHGNAVRVIAAREPATEAARTAKSLYSGEVRNADADVSGDVFVDCLFGSGLTRVLPEDLAALLDRLAAGHRHRIATDVPSGIESDSGRPLNEGLPDCSVTIALGAWKHAHFAMPACASMGALRLVDIGVSAVPGAARVLAKPALMAPAADSHKYRRGMLGILGGEMPGAALLAATAALRAGAGYVKLAAQAAQSGVPAELVVTGDVDALFVDARMAALLVGPGLGRFDAASQVLAKALHAGKPCVIDADALVLLRPEMVGDAPCVLTPHEGEMAALERSFGLSGKGLRRDRALTLAAKSGAVVVFKGPDTVVAGPSGELVLAPRASSWLSVAGTGDVLAGTIASRLATDGQVLRAAEEGLWLHADAAMRCGAAFTAGELAHAVQAALRDCIA
ncbi:MAG: bifunctional ADP-dependent NAD(P)H-hydrate dehydratase/NAD(P)H-hydrate epimerase [Novosphingobium sp. 17-62-19]|uniref:NAD(P)H-hydrate dehydratase n=1 Tax=Novosphingobium sp. 17-62-19 TaxID=1970406 RepID=UPI000BCE7CE6|nr:NAD(P)H-hydrate dehydratase [Novosphingobium sp. 17-62-19]OYX94775.1 MAG: bifunctional ADP-dependent NAD(P)H-hydrate dehydratase/NAD(P)H-hydrate epimerase [Novosphingobium sp. 35-62-5]OZA19624.1 MAG: bifunctional ADP-dependent NAD(P)H-hydrate dehydratase/NAD(P)H-hydrate epimerase [Novosphingobium sp. 17-62-19]OZA68976.1 MAG: bifunctional ADP-dependent NAD(P)H-hydrate dehydratase/NAD(P)H-hydrate epimerase [Sphingomonadales bacterium 39-62-4]HQS96719.1 NAD(P)H-hydrate dehydratase [Novosphingob